MKKVAVLGSTGMAGHVIALYLEEQGFDVYRMSRSEKNSDKSISLDANNIPALSHWLDVISPQIIVNCIGLLQKECDKYPEKAVLINSYLPRFLESKYLSTAVRIIHLSTDCVFSGKRGNYIENDFTDGPTMYDRSKAMGEINNSKDLTFRMSIIGPDNDINGAGLFNWFMKQTGTINGYGKAIWNGVTTIELARGIVAAIGQGLSGLYQLVPEEPIDKYNLLLLVKEAFQKEDIAIACTEDVRINKSLINTRSDFDFYVSSYPDQIMDMKEWIMAHQHLYPHYERYLYGKK
ncbi:dTDP-4-dehydrorhamnose reductase [Desulfitobacterium dehalogenans ATCC 51507]|uniref:dTDP-4-dehydrorhamnose reductase n=1 Tax=Desulfitobacterium dehalogenans (strain ATCC 51507 / DSM 9161 / JW/IU-DC1) TaxID=756499 RepID=I4ADR5_DESDJ|nr:sugar nucleotide-binding protein [Desulfitobacterium dehalogenans]AFM02100.1 dTDP-4-dehydrorhamnose reductase [Desulfitobacterium dehalogenans ATCC 51507]